MVRKLNFDLPRILLAVALLYLAFQLFLSLAEYVTMGYQAITYPYSLDYGEGPLLDQSLRLARFENIYQNNFSTPPYTISNYPPLFILAQVPFARLFGPAWAAR